MWGARKSQETNRGTSAPRACTAGPHPCRVEGRPCVTAAKPRRGTLPASTSQQNLCCGFCASAAPPPFGPAKALTRAAPDSIVAPRASPLGDSPPPPYGTGREERTVDV